MYYDAVGLVSAVSFTRSWYGQNAKKWLEVGRINECGKAYTYTLTRGGRYYRMAVQP